MMRWTRTPVRISLLFAVSVVAGCASGDAPDSEDSAIGAADAGLDTGDVAVDGTGGADTLEPDTADSGGDPEDTRGDVVTCMDRSEECNGEDDDCDGVVDEGCPCNYRGASAGVCSNGTIGESGECRPPESRESDETTCDDLDNDCDGITDEGCECPYNDKSEGVCAQGTVGAEDGMCLEPDGYLEGDEDGFANPDHCDGLDNDCDGVTDGGCPCDYQGKSQGVCTNATRGYVNGKCQKPPAYAADETECDGKDNDCDGEVDEGCNCIVGNTQSCYTGPSGTAGVGICAQGSRECTRKDGDATWTNCQNETLPESEVCGDGTDNDCDGSIDENSATTDGFEGSDTGWSQFNNGSESLSTTTDATDAYNGSESGEASGSNGVCGVGGLSKSFNFSQPADSVTVWVKATTDSWGRVSIMIEDSSGIDTLWRKKGGGSSVNMGWTQKTFDLSSYDSDFTLVFGNDDNSQYCTYPDHGWNLWVDDVTVQGKSCPSP